MHPVLWGRRGLAGHKRREQIKERRLCAFPQSPGPGRHGPLTPADGAHPGCDPGLPASCPAGGESSSPPGGRGWPSVSAPGRGVCASALLGTHNVGFQLQEGGSVCLRTCWVPSPRPGGADAPSQRAGGWIPICRARLSAHLEGDPGPVPRPNDSDCLGARSFFHMREAQVPGKGHSAQRPHQA